MKKDQTSMKEKNDLQALFLMGQIQGKTIETIQETNSESIKETISLLDQMINYVKKFENNIDQFSTIIEGMDERIKALEEKTMQKKKLRVVQ